MMISTPETEVEPWQIRIANVRFKENPAKGKARPVLILSTDPDGIEALKITTNGDVPFPTIGLSHWELNLRRASWLQLEPTFPISKQDVGPMIGYAPLELREIVCALLI